MLDIIFLNTYLSITGSLYLFTAFIQFSLHSTTTSGNHKFDLFFYKFVYFWSTVDIQHHVSSCYRTEWFAISVHFKLITATSLVTICHHARIYKVINYILLTLYFMPVTHLFCSWKFAPLNLPYPFPPSPLTYLFMSVTLFKCCWFVHLYSTYKWNQTIYSDFSHLS